MEPRRRLKRAATPRALTIAGSDSGGGAGIQADLKTFTALGVFGTTAITAITAQNTRGVLAVHAVPPDFVRAQIEAVATDIGFDAVKTGMLANAAIVTAVAECLAAHRVRRLVVDPVMRAASGDALLSRDAEHALAARLLPQALLVTPNAFEAAALAGMEVRGESDQVEAARRIAKLGARAVLVKGGRLSGKTSLDVLYYRGVVARLAAARVIGPRGPGTHGAGCVLSAAIAAHLARGAPLEAAVAGAKRFVTRAIRRSLPVGRGTPPVRPG